MPESYILGIDQGTTSTTAQIFDFSNPNSPKSIGKMSIEFPQSYPQSGWVSHHLPAIWDSVARAVPMAMTAANAQDPRFSPHKITAIGLTNQRETLCTFERGTGRPLYDAIVWQCKRSNNICERLRQAQLQSTVQKKTGLLLDPYFSGSKITWLMENVPNIQQAVVDKRALFGTIDTWLLYQLTGQTSYATEASNASRTLLYNLSSGDFDSDLMTIFKVPHRECLPQIFDSAGLFGHTKGLSFLPDGIPITGILGDQQAALAGQACFLPGEAKCTYGTGAFILINAGNECPVPPQGLLTTVAWSLQGQKTFALEGSTFIAGAAIQFLRDQWGLLTDYQELEDLCRAVSASPDLYFVPALAGLGSPYWIPQARGAILGMTRGTTKAQLARAALEGIAFSVNDLFDVMRQSLPVKAHVLRVDGGAARNNVLMAIQADISHVTIDRPQNLESTSTGAALFAAYGVGIYKSVQTMSQARLQESLITPGSGFAAGTNINNLKKGWERAIQAVKIFATDA